MTETRLTLEQSRRYRNLLFLNHRPLGPNVRRITAISDWATTPGLRTKTVLAARETAVLAPICAAGQ